MACLRSAKVETVNRLRPDALAHGKIWLTVLSFAAVPVFNAVSQLAPSFPPERTVVLGDLLIVTGVAALILAILWTISRDLFRGGVCLSVALMPFGFYAPVYGALSRAGLDPYERIAAIAFLTLCAAAGLWTLRLQSPSRAILLNILSLVALVFAANSMFLFWRYYIKDAQTSSPVPKDVFSQVSRPAAPLPDIYHVILDEFGRPDTLRRMYGVDLSSFVQDLAGRGYDVSEDQAIANYTQTYLSLASMLNGQYLEGISPEEYSREPAQRLIQASEVMKTAKRLGYRIDFFGSIYSATERHALADRCDCYRPFVGEFESLIVRNTPLAPLGFGGLDYRPHRQKIRHTFTALESLPPSQQPRMVLAHLMVPHPPFVFDGEGRDIHSSRSFDFSEGTLFTGASGEYRRGYANQVRFVVNELRRMVDHFADVSRAEGRDYAVIIHGDHGPRQFFDHLDPRKTNASEVVPIFLAIRWPAACDTRAWRPVTSLVNVYRALFASCFAARIEKLSEHAYASSFARPYDFLAVTPLGTSP